MYRKVACGIVLMLAAAAGTAISAQSNQQKAREAAARQSREAAARQAREAAARQASEAAARQSREAAARQAREAAARQAREAAARQAREAAARQAREAAARQAREAAARQAREAAARQARAAAARQAREAATKQAREAATRQAREMAARQAREAAARQAREAVARQARERARKQALGKMTPAQRKRFDQFERRVIARRQLNRRPPNPTTRPWTKWQQTRLDGLARTNPTLKGALNKFRNKQPLTPRERIALQTGLGRAYSPLSVRGPRGLGLPRETVAKLRADPRTKGLYERLARNRLLTGRDLALLRRLALQDPAWRRIFHRLNLYININFVNNVVNNFLPACLGGLPPGWGGFIAGGGCLPPIPCGPGEPPILPPYPCAVLPNDPNVPDGPGACVSVLPGPGNFIPGPDGPEPTGPGPDGPGPDGPGPDGPGPDDPGPDGPGPGPEDPEVASQFGSLVATDLPLQNTRKLLVVNNSKEKATVLVQYHGPTEEGDWKWFPGEPGSDQTLTFEVEPGESIQVVDGDWPIRADRVRVWATGEMTQWNQFKDRDLVLVPEVDDAGNRGYRALDVQTTVFAIR
jgi:hypothetical protein